MTNLSLLFLSKASSQVKFILKVSNQDKFFIFEFKKFSTFSIYDFICKAVDHSFLSKICTCTNSSFILHESSAVQKGYISNPNPSKSS